MGNDCAGEAVTDALVISAEQAAVRGLRLYFTGIPCKHGHVGPRRVSDRYCCECKRRNVPIEPRGPQPRELLGQNIREYERVQWPDDGGSRVETVVDPNWLIDGKPRVVRRIGWRTCMCCKRRMFSADISKIRICDLCKDITSELTYDRMRGRVPEKRPRRPRYVYQFNSG